MATSAKTLRATTDPHVLKLCSTAQKRLQSRFHPSQTSTNAVNQYRISAIEEQYPEDKDSYFMCREEQKTGM